MEAAKARLREIETGILRRKQRKQIEMWEQDLQDKLNKCQEIVDAQATVLSFLDLTTLPTSDTDGGNDSSLIPINMSLFRVLRVARIAKLIKSSVGLKALMSTMIKSFPSLINVTSLLGLLFFMFAVMGMNLFGSYDTDPNDGTREIRKCEFLSVIDRFCICCCC